MSVGLPLRLSRILSPESGNGIIVALDHGLFIGPLPGIEDLHVAVSKLFPGQPDGIQITPGTARQNAHLFHGHGKPALVVRVDATNQWRKLPAPKEIYHSLVASPEEAIRLGADAIVCFLFTGYETDRQEGENLERIAALGEAAHRLGLPFIVEPLGIATGVNVIRDAEVIKLLVRMAAEVQADIIKADYPNTQDEFKAIVECAGGTPIMVRGGPKMETFRGTLEMVKDAMDAGARGLVFGRNVWQHDDPSRILGGLRAIVHKGASVDDALSIAGE